MALKISQLTASAALTSDDFFPVVDSGSLFTLRASAQQILDYVTGSTFNRLTVTALTASAMQVQGAAVFSGSMLLYGTASLSANPTAAYLVYSSSLDKLVAFPGLYVSGNLTGSGLGAFQTLSASTYLGLPTSSGGTPGGLDTTIQFNSGSTFSGSTNLIYDYTANILSGTTAQFTVISASVISASSYIGIQNQGISGNGSSGQLTLWDGASSVIGKSKITWEAVTTGGSFENRNRIVVGGGNNNLIRIQGGDGQFDPPFCATTDYLASSVGNNQGIVFYTDNGSGFSGATRTWSFNETSDGYYASKMVAWQDGDSAKERISFRKKTSLIPPPSIGATAVAEVVINHSQQNVNFRVASDLVDSALLVQGSTSNVGIQITNTTSGIAHWSSTPTTIYVTNPSPNWTTNAYVGLSVEIVYGTGAGQVRTVVSNTSDTLTISPAWTTTPTTDSQFVVGMPSAAFSVAEKFKVHNNGNTIVSGNLTVTGSIFVSGSSIYGQVAELTSSTDNYVLLSQDSGKFLNVNSSSAVNVTVPAGLPTGFTISVCQLGSGSVTFVTGSGVTINNRQGHTKTAGQFAVASIVGTAADVYVLVGDTTT